MSSGSICGPGMGGTHGMAFFLAGPWMRPWNTPKFSASRLVFSNQTVAPQLQKGWLEGITIYGYQRLGIPSCRARVYDGLSTQRQLLQNVDGTKLRSRIAWKCLEGSVTVATALFHLQVYCSAYLTNWYRVVIQCNQKSTACWWFTYCKWRLAVLHVDCQKSLYCRFGMTWIQKPWNMSLYTINNTVI